MFRRGRDLCRTRDDARRFDRLCQGIERAIAARGVNRRKRFELAQAQLAQHKNWRRSGNPPHGIGARFDDLLMIVTGHARTLLHRLSEPEKRRALEAIPVGRPLQRTLTRQLLMCSPPVR